MIEPGNGILLISDPFLKDPNFMRTVVLLCEHNAEGTFGLVINRTLSAKLGDLIHDLTAVSLPVYYGGPVQTDTLHFIHQLPHLIPGSQEIAKGIYWGGDFSLLSTMLKNKSIDTSKIRFYLGYSGWGDGQLDEEMKEKSWLTVTGNKTLVFHTDANAIWKDALKQMGGQYEQLVNYPIDPQLN